MNAETLCEPSTIPLKIVRLKIAHWAAFTHGLNKPG
jgi:hypothetical protein